MEENNEVKVEQPVVVTKTNKGALWLLIIIIILLLGACGFFAFKFFTSKDNTTKCPEQKCEEKKEEEKPATCNCPNDDKPTTTNIITKAETTMEGYTFYQTNDGYYISFAADDNKTSKKYVIGDEYVNAYKVNYKDSDAMVRIEYLEYGNGGGGLFIILESNGENSDSFKLYYIDLYSVKDLENITPVTNDKLKNISYVYTGYDFGASNAYAVTTTGEKLNLYDFIKTD